MAVAEGTGRGSLRPAGRGGRDGISVIVVGEGGGRGPSNPPGPFSGGRHAGEGLSTCPGPGPAAGGSAEGRLDVAGSRDGESGVKRPRGRGWSSPGREAPPWSSPWVLRRPRTGTWELTEGTFQTVAWGLRRAASGVLPHPKAPFLRLPLRPGGFGGSGKVCRPGQRAGGRAAERRGLGPAPRLEGR